MAWCAWRHRWSRPRTLVHAVPLLLFLAWSRCCVAADVTVTKAADLLALLEQRGAAEYHLSSPLLATPSVTATLPPGTVLGGPTVQLDFRQWQSRYPAFSAGQ